MKTITIPLETYKCLRGHLEKANEIFGSLVAEDPTKKGKVQPPTKKEPTRTQKLNNYMDMIVSGKRGSKPDHLKKK